MFQFYRNKKTKEIVRAQKFFIYPHYLDYLKDPQRIDFWMQDFYQVADNHRIDFSYEDMLLLIKNAEGNYMDKVEYGDFLIVNDKAEYYSCRKEDFHKDYEVV